MNLEDLKKQGHAPEWLKEEGFKTLTRGYLLTNETPKEMWQRVSKASANRLGMPELSDKFFQLFWNNWLCAASPILSNMGANRGLPISCFGQAIDDSIDSIFKSYHESAMLIKNGGGIGKYWGDVQSDIVPWMKLDQDTYESVSQGGVRRGAGAAYYDIEGDFINDFLDIRRPTGDISRRCLSTNFHHAVTIGDQFMQNAVAGKKHEREVWEKLLKTRIELGEPYLMFRDTANRTAPIWYKDQKLEIKTSQLCNEIFLFNDKEHTFVCCLSSMNLLRYDEWKNTDAVFYAILFLDGVMEEFIDKARHIPGMTKSVRFSEKSRALGLGVLGWHTFLQSKMIPFDSFESMMLNAEIFRSIQGEAIRASKWLAEKLGEPEWLKGYGMRNSHLLAVAPTVSNSLISGGVSQGIEPIISNIYAQKSAKGTFIRKNPTLENLLEQKGKNELDVWLAIEANGGSVKGLDFLTKEEKEVFLTAKELNQFAIIKQAGQRQKFIDQGQSVNLFFQMPENITNPDDRKKLGKYIHEVHLAAWTEGLKGLYYVRPESALKGDAIYRNASDCASCEG